MIAGLQTPAAIESGNTICRVLIEQADRYGDKPLIRFPRDQATVTYAGLVASSEWGSTRLHNEYHLQPGAMAAIYLGNCADYVTSWFTCLFAGLIDVPLNHEFKKTVLLFGLATVQAEVVFTDAPGLANLTDIEVRDYLKSLRLLVIAGAYDPAEVRQLLASIDHPPPVIALDDLLRPGLQARVWDGIDATGPALIRFTSGTTGPAKGVLQSHLHVLGKSMVHNRILGYASDDVLYSPFPLHHNLASVNGLIGTLQAGATMVSIPRFSASRFWEDARQCGATLGHLLQSIAPLVSAQPPSHADAEHNVRSLWTGGPDPEFERRFNTSWVQTYALGEIGAVSYKRGGSVGDSGAGLPLPEMDVRIVDPLDQPVATGVTGEITIRPRQPHRVMLAYHNNLSATMRAFKNLWFHTGDAGYLSETGELHFIGRIGDTIRRRGVNISSDQIEGELRRHPDVLDCGVIAVPAETGDQEIHACVLWRDAPADQVAAFKDVVRFLSERLARDYIPRFYETVSDFPRTNTGKIQKAVLRARELRAAIWDRQRDVMTTAEPNLAPGRSA